MSLKTIPANHLGPGRTVKFGRRRPVAAGPRLRLANYLRATLPVAPASVDYSPAGQPALSNIYGNDTLGDCVIAGGYHVVATTTGNAGRLFTASSEQIIKDYSAIGGYVPGDPSTDNGCDEPTALNYWLANAFANGTKPLGWLTVDASNRSELQAALFLFENLYLGVELPDAWVSPMPSQSGFVWDVAGKPDPQNGHCVIAVGYGDKGLTIDTWGLLGTVTWAAAAKYFVPTVYGAIYVLLTPDQLTSGQTKAPNGVDWTALIADFDSIGGTVPAPAPSPSPSPPPTPPSPTPGPAGAVTLAQAQAMVSRGFQGRHSLLTKQQAIDTANAALAAGWPSTTGR